jgi:hypothetical protein
MIRGNLGSGYETTAPQRRWLRRVRYRVRQFAAYLPRTGRADIDNDLRALLAPSEWRLLSRLAPADRRHALAVRRGLEADGWTDSDLLRAALLHDVGKADERGRVYLLHRVMRVLLGAFAPRALDRLAARGEGWWQHGLYLSVHHPRIGAAHARLAGAPERVCWLIAHHGDGTRHDDPALRALQQADEG